MYSNRPSFSNDSRRSYEEVSSSQNTRNPVHHRISRRSFSRHPPAGSAESNVDVFSVLDSILGPPILQPSSNDDLSFLDRVMESDDLTCTETRLSRLATMSQSQDYAPIFPQKRLEYQQVHADITVTDDIFDSLEKYLNSFQTELKSLSADMETLENRSQSLNSKLITRQLAEQKLSSVVEALIIPPSIVRQISNGEISIQWLAALKYIAQRQNELNVLLQERGEFAAIKAAKHHLDIIASKSVERIRDFIGSRIKALRVFGVNSQAIQKELLEFRDLYAFLKTLNLQLAGDLQQAYINTMRWYYHSYFSRYIKSLEKMNVHRVTKSVLLGSDDKKGGLFNKSTRSLMDNMSLGNRANIISSDDPSVILAQIAEHSGSNASNNSSSNVTYYMETGFRSLNLALLDNATVEYQFLSDFFKLKAGDSINKVFNTIFDHTFLLGQEYTTKFLAQDSYDAYGILICIRLCRKLEFELQHRRVPVMESYLNLQLINLWPKFQSVMDAHCESLHRSTSKMTLHSFVSDSNLAGNSALVPHPLTQTFSSFVAGILALCENDDSESEPVARSLLRLRNEFENVLTKLSAAAFSASKREKFLYNNYSLVSTILSDISGPLAEQERSHFLLLTEAYGNKG